MRQGTFYKIPEAGDRGKTWCPAVSENFDSLDSHDHDGINSKKISAKSIEKFTTVLSSGDWVATDQGYKQTVTVPSGFDMDNAIVKCQVASGSMSGAQINPSLYRTSLTTLDVFVTLNTFDLRVVIA